MNRSGVARERIIALFILGILLLSPPFLLIFDRAEMIAGIPMLFFYLLVAWVTLIALMALVNEYPKDARTRSQLMSKPEQHNGGWTGQSDVTR